MALEEQRQAGGLEGMKGVARLMQERANVVVNADRVHKDQRLLSEIERLAVGAGCLALAVLQVEQLCFDHRFVIATKYRIDVPEDVRGTIHERIHIREWFQGGSPERVDRGIPGPKAIELHLAPPPSLDPLDRRQYRFLHRLMESQAVIGRVRESVLLLVRVVPKVVKA